MGFVSGTITYVIFSSTTLTTWFTSVIGGLGVIFGQAIIPTVVIFILALGTAMIVRTLHPLFLLFVYGFFALLTFIIESGASAAVLANGSLTSLVIPLLAIGFGTALALVPSITIWVSKAGR